MTVPPIDLDRLNALIARDLDRNIQDLGRLVAIPSVAAQNRGIGEGADLVAELLEERGFAASVLPGPGNPVVFGESTPGSAPDDAPALLFYNHYDVQPAEPLELWDSDPFTLARRGDRLFARGVSDDKGHFIARLAALDAVRELNGGRLPCRVKFVVEGEEEIGSVSMPDIVQRNRERLAADACVWEFGGVNEDGRPMQYLGLRGICYVELSVKTASMDAHSGLGGSIFPNAAWRLVWALASLKGPDERILIPGHYDPVKPPTATDLELLNAMPDTSEAVLRFYGLSGFLGGLAGGAELRRQEVFVPTCTIAGLDSGYQGPGSKTIIPAEARAKIDFRLVPDQSPEEVLANLRQHLDARGFEDIAITYLGGGRPAKTDPDHPFIAMCNAAARLAYGVDPVVAPMIGGSGPNWPFTHTLQLPITSCGIGYPGGQVHAPNEHVVIDHLVTGIRHTALITLGFAAGNRLG